MELIFTKQADRWVAEFIATDDFNLHIEGVVEGNVSVFQRGSESGNYAFVKEGTPHPSYANVYDYDFAALIYPKFIKVSCATEPTSGIVTSDGEITEIKAQTKEIEVTSNGTTTVAPDAGFAYLNSVKVKTNVPQSGEGGGSSELKRNDVNFFDYDGTLLYAYSWDEAKNLTELPALPVHDGFEVREWNYTLEDIKAQGTDTIKGKADVGAVVYGTNGIQLTTEGVIIYERGLSSISTKEENRVFQLVSIPNTVSSIGADVFSYNAFLQGVVIPISVNTVGNEYYPAFWDCIFRDFWWNGEHLWSPCIDDAIFSEPFNVPINCTYMDNASLICTGHLIFHDRFQGLKELQAGLSSAQLLDFSKLNHVPVLERNTSNFVKIVVPDALYDDWINSTNWSMLKDRTYKFSESPWHK